MNNRIKDIIKQTGLRIELLTNDDNEDINCVTAAGREHVSLAEMEKFAELIVKECVSSIRVWRDAHDELMDKEAYFAGYQAGCDDSIVEIMMRFGVKV